MDQHRSTYLIKNRNKCILITNEEIGMTEGFLIFRKLEDSVKQSFFFLRQLTLSRSQDLVGLDIGSDFIKLLEISSTQPQSIKNFSVYPVPAGAIVKGEVKNYAIVGSILEKMFQENSIKTKNVALAIPRLAVIIKKFTVDNRLTADEIESRTWLEANRYFPDLVGNVYLDFVVLGPAEKDATQNEIMIVACRKEQIKSYLEVLQQQGLNVKIVDVDNYALQRALSLVNQQMPELETVALLNFDANLISLIVTHKDNLIYTHEQNYDGHELMKKVEAYLSKKGSIDFSEDSQYMEILKEGIGSSLRHTMQFFYSNKNNTNIQRLVLSGDIATVPYLDRYVQQAVGIETLLADPFKNMVMADSIDKKKIQQLSPTLMLSCGLALSKDYESN